MVLGISYAELLLLTGTGLYLIGAKDLPRFARQAGQFTGRAVSYVSAFRKQAFSFADETELIKVHREVQASMQQLQAIRNEMRSGINVFSPRFQGTETPKPQGFHSTKMDAGSMVKQPNALARGGAPEAPTREAPRAQEHRASKKALAGRKACSQSLMQDLMEEEFALHQKKRTP